MFVHLLTPACTPRDDCLEYGVEGASMAKTIKRTRSVSRVANPASPELGPTESAIAARAFELHCERGRQHGSDIEDWLQAERELRDAAHLSVA